MKKKSAKCSVPHSLWEIVPEVDQHEVSFSEYIQNTPKNSEPIYHEERKLLEYGVGPHVDCEVDDDSSEPDFSSYVLPNLNSNQEQSNLTKKKKELKKTKKQNKKLSLELKKTKKQKTKLSLELKKTKKQKKELSLELKKTKKQKIELSLELKKTKKQKIELSLELIYKTLQDLKITKIRTIIKQNKNAFIKVQNSCPNKNYLSVATQLFENMFNPDQKYWMYMNIRSTLGIPPHEFQNYQHIYTVLAPEAALIIFQKTFKIKTKIQAIGKLAELELLNPTFYKN